MACETALLVNAVRYHYDAMLALPSEEGALKSGPTMPMSYWRKTWQDAGEQLREGCRQLPDFLLPCAFFAVGMFPVAFIHGAVWYAALASVVGGGASARLFQLSGNKLFKALSAACFAATLLGLLCGKYVYYAHIYEAELYATSRVYTNVLPTDAALAMQDASMLVFSSDAWVDLPRSIGLDHDGRYCVAPILTAAAAEDATPEGTLQVNFWAVGKDCCSQRGGWLCGSTARDAPQGGVVVLDGSPLRPGAKPWYLQAARMVSEEAGLVLPQAYEPSFVLWGTTLDSRIENEWRAATRMYLALCSVLVCAAFAVACALPWCGVAVARKQDRSPLPHPDVAAKMEFGFLSSMRSSWQLDHDLLEGRAYWSGEVFHDYAFYLSNSHILLGIIACHPMHPFTKLERLMVCCLVSMLVVFPAAALDVVVGHCPPLQLMVVAGCVLLPRWLVHPVLDVVTQGSTPSSRRATRRMWALEAGIFACMVTLVAVLSWACAQICQAGTDKPIGQVLLESCPYLFLACVLDVAVDLVRPQVVEVRALGVPRQICCWGFFDRWLTERATSSSHPDYDKRFVVFGP